MTKNEIIRELTKTDPFFIGRLFVSFYDKKSNIRYTFTYMDTLSHTSTQSARKELVCVLSSLYKLRYHIECLRVVYMIPTIEGDWLERYYESSKYVYSVSDFIKSI